MYTKVKTEAEITAMRESGRLLATVLATLKEALQPEMTTKDLAEIAKRELRGTGGTPTFLGQYGFPDVICISVNDEIVHGIPSAKRVIKDSDIISLDFGVTYEGMITDSATSVIAGSGANQKIQNLVRETEAALFAGVQELRHGVRVGDIAHAIQQTLEKDGYGIVRDLVGHGVGHELHEDPNIPNFGKKGTGPQLSAGMTIAIEPMATLGDFRVYIDTDGWTVRTNDRSLAAHFEHTVLITQDGAEILTQL
jgi:methionyl aminopeptidase